MYDIIFVDDRSQESKIKLEQLRERFPLIKTIVKKDKVDYSLAFKKSQTKMFWLIDLEYNFYINPDFDFDYRVPEWDQQYVHVFNFGVYLIPRDYPVTRKEAEYNFFMKTKKIDIDISSYKKFERFTISNMDDLFSAQPKCNTSMFYAIKDDCLVDPSFEFDYEVPRWDREYIHTFSYGIYLIPRDYPITKKEAEYNFFMKTKKVDLVISKRGFEHYRVSTYEDYLEAQSKCNTSMFYAIKDDCLIDPEFNFDYEVPMWDREYIHTFSYGIYLIPRDYTITKKEAEYNFFMKTKKVDLEISRKGFDVIFISYQEPNADENFEKLKNRFPYAKRIHGIKGIHQAHIAAAELANTYMFWVVDGDAIIIDDFDFEHTVEKWERTVVSVWCSQNPVNGLVYGYGGVKLLPTDLTRNLNIDSSDMTTSISKRFKIMNSISNETVFNTDPFNTWKSAFRECVKLSSNIIIGQKIEETQERLETWCTIGKDKPYGDYSIRGALEGKEFGSKYADDPNMISKINDWDWLLTRFNQE